MISALILSALLAAPCGYVPLIVNCDVQQTKQRFANVQHDLQNIQFVSTKHGFAVGNHGTLVSTTNGGKKWTSIDLDVSHWINNVYFADAKHGWIVGDHGFVSRTTDGGQSWHASPTDLDLWLNDIYFVDNQTGWFVGYKGTIAKTTDGGQTWTVQETPTKKHLESIYFANADEGWAVGWKGTLLETTDGGQTWILQETPATADLEMIHGYTSENGRKRVVVVGDSGLIMNKSTYSNRWYRVWYINEMPDVEFVQDIEFEGVQVMEDHSIVTGDDGHVLLIAHANMQVRKMDVAVEEDLRDVFAYDGVLWAAGTEGAIYRINYDFNVTRLHYDYIRPELPEEAPVEVNATQDLKIFPNPNNGRFVIQPALEPAVPAMLSLLDMHGRIVYHQQVEQGDLSAIHMNMNLPAGNYVISYVEGDFSMSEVISISDRGDLVAH